MYLLDKTQSKLYNWKIFMGNNCRKYYKKRIFRYFFGKGYIHILFTHDELTIAVLNLINMVSCSRLRIVNSSDHRRV